jgi:hypothetical protein
MDVHAEQPFFLRFLAGALGSDYGDNGFNGSVREIDSDKQKAAEARQIGLGKTSADERQPHTKLADRLAMTSRGLGIRNFADLYFSINQRDGGGQVSVKTWSTTPILKAFFLFGWGALMCAERIEPLEYEPAIVAEEFMHSDHTQQHDCIIVIPLNPLALAPWALHRSILADTLGYNGDGAIRCLNNPI